MAGEKRLIDRNDIFPNGAFFANAEDPLKSLDELIKTIWSIPTVDAVEVVRCKDCKNYEAGYVRRDHGWCKEWGTAVRASGFCHHGERKTDE